MKPIIKYLFISYILSRSFAAMAQQSEKPVRVELAFNITNALSRFAGNGARNVNEDPYLFAVKWVSKNQKNALRLGINQVYTHQRTELFPGSRDSRESYVSPILGYERRIRLDKKFMFYYGADLRYGYRKNVVNSFFSSGLNNVVSEEEKAYGAGPICGFAWQPISRLLIYTEANVYLSYHLLNRTYFDGSSTYTLEKTKKFQWNPVIPTSIFLAVRF